MCQTASRDELILENNLQCLFCTFHYAESHGLMDFDYTDVKPDLSGLTVKGRHGRAQMVLVEVELRCTSDAMINNSEGSSEHQRKVLCDCFIVTHITYSDPYVNYLIFINILKKVYHLGQEAVEYPALFPPTRRLLSDFPYLASCIRVPCQPDWVAGHGSLQRMLNQYANWAQNLSPRFPAVWKRRKNIKSQIIKTSFCYVG